MYSSQNPSPRLFSESGGIRNGSMLHALNPAVRNASSYVAHPPVEVELHDGGAEVERAAEACALLERLVQEPVAPVTGRMDGPRQI